MVADDGPLGSFLIRSFCTIGIDLGGLLPWHITEKTN